jgi:predicted PurR-regulated permease PerM
VFAAVIILIIVLGGIAYGIYSVTQNGSNTKQTIAKSNHLVNPTPPSASKNNQKKTVAPSTTSGKSSAAVNKNTSSSTTSSTSSTSSSSGQLTNTGPGSTAVVGFISAFLLGMLLHYLYLWRKRHLV